jgi:uncharacterized protein (TIGR00266 family)
MGTFVEHERPIRRHPECGPKGAPGIAYWISTGACMAFCTGCGNELNPGGKFCPRCGAPAPVAAGAAEPAAATSYASYEPEPLEYEIVGDNLQVARITLKAGQEIFAEAGKMIYKSPNVFWETRMSGQSIGEKIWGAVKRKLMGESLFLTYFRTGGDVGEVGFAGSYPGRIQAFPLKAGQNLMVQRDGFLFAQSPAQLNIALVKKLGAGFFGGEGFILEKLSGPGVVFVHAGGDFIEWNLDVGQSIQVESGHIVAFDEGVDYDIQFVGGIKTAIFGGEGLFLATLTGPGKVVIQSMTLSKLRQEMAPGRVGGDERKPWETFSNILSPDD